MKTSPRERADGGGCWPVVPITIALWALAGGAAWIIWIVAARR